MVMQAYDVTEYPTVEELIEEVILDEEELVVLCEEEEGCEVPELVDEGLVDSPVGFARAGIPGLNLEFSKPVTISLSVDPKYRGVKLDIVSFEEGDIAWANETTCTVSEDSKCSFTVNHASYFAATYKPTGSIKINSNAAQTYSKYVTLYPAALSKAGTITHMKISNGQNKWTGWRAYKTKYTSWNITSSTYGGSTKEGTKTVYIQFKDSKGNISKIYTSQIIYNPRKITPITVSRYVSDGKASKEYVRIYNRLRGDIKLGSWYFYNLKGTKRTLPSNLVIKAGKTVTIYSKKGTNTSTAVYLGLSNTSENWRDSRYDRFKLYTNKGKLLYTRYLY